MQSLAYAFLTSFLTTALLLQWWQKAGYPVVLLFCIFGLIGIFGILKRLRTSATLFGVLLALLSVAREAHVPTSNTVDFYADSNSWTVEGVVADEPDRRPIHTKYTIAADRMTNASGTVLEGVQGKVLINDYRNWPQYHYGDRIQVAGMLEQPGEIDGFRYDHYLSRFGIYSVMYRASIEPLETGALSIHAMLYSLKESFEAQINRLFPEPHASFMAGLLTGSRRGIPEDLMESFNATGLTHIIAISGYNITIVIALIGSALFWLQPRFRLLPSIGAIILFTIFVGASAAVVRAAIMGILGLLALSTNRIADVQLTILWTAFFMVAWNPKILWYDAGFQLSFLAVIGLVELAPLLDPLFRNIPDALAIRESLQMTMAAQIAAVPLIVVLFGRVSLVAPIANMLVAPAIPLAMLFGAVGTTFSFALFPLGQMIAYLGWGCLEWIILVARFCQQIPFASVNVHLNAWTLILYYSLLLLTIRRASTSWSRKSREQELS